MVSAGRFVVSASLLVAVGLGVGLILFDWVVGAGLAALAIAGESLRVWIRRTRRRRSSGI